MKRLSVGIIFLSLVFLLGGESWGRSTYDCAIPDYRDEKCRIGYSYSQSTVIFLGKLKKVDKRRTDMGWYATSSTFHVQETYRGHAMGEVVVDSGEGVNPPNKVNGYYVVFASKVSTDQYLVNPCSFYKFRRVISPLADSPLQAELKRIAMTRGWKFDSDKCETQKRIQIKGSPQGFLTNNALHDSRNKKD